MKAVKKPAKKAATKATKATKKAPGLKARKTATKKVVAKKSPARPARPAKIEKPLAERLSDLQRNILLEVSRSGGLAKEGFAIRPYPTRAIRTLIDAGLLLGDTVKARLSAVGKRLLQNLPAPVDAPVAT
jgi:hypothetical protein